MFTGIVESLGSLVKKTQVPSGLELRFSADFARELKPGDSVAVNGACVTVTECDSEHFLVDLSSESIARTTMQKLKTGSRVNLERALGLTDRIGGHLVTGHVDGTGRILERRPEGDCVEFVFQVPDPLLKYCAEKGSVAIDGISLTLAGVKDRSITVAVIPFTLKNTTLERANPGDEVNIETDVLAKYVERLLGGKGSHEGVDLDLLARSGYL